MKEKSELGESFPSLFSIQNQPLTLTKVKVKPQYENWSLDLIIHLYF